MGHELALCVVFESGWQVLCDVPEAYLNSPARTFLKDLPAAWDESMLLSGYPGEFCCMARRNGKVWYVAGISAGEPREVTLDLSFLLTGQKSITVYGDSPDRADALEVSEIELSGTAQLTLHLKENGGFAFKLPDMQIRTY